MKKVFVSNDDKPFRGQHPEDFIGVDIEKHEGGFILTVGDNDKAYRIAQALMEDGHETVRIIGD